MAEVHRRKGGRKHVSPAYAEIDGQKAELVDMGITMSRDGEEHA